MSIKQQNWSTHHAFRATRFHAPETIAELQTLVSGSRKVKAVGSGHSFHDIADSVETLISLDQLDQTIAVDPNRQTVTVNAGITYGQLCRQLQQQGYALRNLASLPHITVAGACATATHGSGDRLGNLATAVVALELVKANGDRVVLDREQDGEQFQGAVVALGGLGVVTKVTLEIVPTFMMQQLVYENLPVTQLAEHFDEILAHAYSVSLFTDWQSEGVNQVWLKEPITVAAAQTVAPTFFGATAAPVHRHPVTSRPADACTEQMGIPGLWHDRLPHFRIDSTLTGGKELQTEYFVARHHAVAAVRAVATLRTAMAPVLILSELRTIAADTLWMSPSYQQATVGFHFSWHNAWPAVQQVLPLLEKRLAPFQPRPHWGKLFTLSPAEVQACYPKLPDFRDLLHTYDPTGKFRNAFLETYIFE